MMNNNWYTVQNINVVDSPALLLYKERIQHNIREAIVKVTNIRLLRPHVKTNKIAEVCRMMMDEGITKFKCATIAEAEMLGTIGALDVLLAYQPIGPKIARFIELANKFPTTKFSCLFDNEGTAREIASSASKKNIFVDVFIDCNVGMNRTGIEPKNVLPLYTKTHALKGIRIIGLHAYDGHITDKEFSERKKKSDAAFAEVEKIQQAITLQFNKELLLVAGGSPTFAVHALRKNVECSPGTFVFWDWSYASTYPEEPFQLAALVVARVISIVNETKITIDLGHKSIAAENPLPRVHFLNVPEAKPVSHSEEHMVLQVAESSQYKIGDVLYGVPIHVCPTVALYERAHVVEDGTTISEWKVIARDKKISI